ncbi:MAG TPA: 5-formyltetrahydrofolate cyclo-ligase [Chthoniobacterales bacterium]|nr:5-formyltetrahydrofolate cyclo-ligase [Chthoniobacterales bacterium]
MANPRTQFSDKSQLRETMRERSSRLSPVERQKRSRRICEKLYPLFGEKKRLGLFAPTESEPDLDLLWSLEMLRDHLVAYPRCDGDILAFRPVSGLGDLVRGKFGIREPGPGPGIEVLDLIVVPGVAFSAGGNRLGRGRGFYDRLLATIPVTTATVGVCFEFQLLAEILCEPHDRDVDIVVCG